MKMSKFCVGNLQFSLSSDNLLGSDGNGKVFKGTFKGESVAVKKLSLSSNIYQNEQHWEKLIKLQDEHLVSYHQCKAQDNVRYLVMQLCQGSMLDYCRKTLDVDVASHVNAIDVMWQITCGLDYLQYHQINHGDLKLKNVLFWKRDSKSKRVVVKLTGYGYNYHQSERKIGIPSQLGFLFYSAATKEEVKPNRSISFGSLTEIVDVTHKSRALDLINLLGDGSLSNCIRSVELGTLLRHPLFTRWTDEGRSRLIQDLMSDKAGLVWNDREKLCKWFESIDEENFPDEDLDDFKDILLKSENKDISKIASEAFKTTPQLFSEYIWHIAIGSREIRNTVPKENNKSHSIKIQEELGKGNYGKVYKCKYTDGNGKRYPAACKKCKTKKEAEDVFNREIETLRKLNHLFVVKYLDVVEKDSKKFIVMELCEGSLKDYVEGKLEQIPKDSLDEKILVGQITLGLTYMHSKGIIHKDIKLENILLKCLSPGLVLAKIADFGFAKKLKPGKSEFSETAHPGTETYMAPELLNADDDAYPATFASDVYALGITIARIVLKGEHPFSPNEIYRKISMIKGLVPQNLQGFGWDLIDLILKLTDQDPEKRPEMVLVLRHPYFVLTNDRTKRHLIDQLWADFKLLPEEDLIKHIEKIFNYRNFREWYETISKDKLETAEEIEKMTETLQLFRSLRPGVQANTLYPAKQYKRIIKEAIQSEHDANVENKINQIVPLQGILNGLSWYRLHKLIQRAPKLFVPYLWSYYLVDINDHSKSIISELEWSSLYYDDEEIVDELWNIKYSENYENPLKTIVEIVSTVGNCNVSERVWSALLNRLGKRAATALMGSAIRSHSSNAPRVTEMILQKYGITEEMVTVIHDTAWNVGDWADKIMEVVLKYGGKPNAIAPSGRTPVHHAAQNDSHLGPKIMKLLLENGGNPNAQFTLNDFTPIHLAAFNEGDYAAEILKLLLDSGGIYNAVTVTDEGSLEPIHLATINIGGSATVVLDLLLKKRGIDVINNKTGMSLVHYAAQNNGECGPKITKKLIENGANPNIRDNEKQTPLHLAAKIEEYQNIVANIAILLENGGDPNAIDELGNTPVHSAAANGGEQSHEKLKVLLAHGGDLAIKNKNGLTPVHAAFLNTGICGAKIRELVGANEQCANVALDNNGETLLHRVIGNAEFEIEHAQLILDNGGNPNVVDNRGRSPVHYVVLNKNQSCVQLGFLQLLLKKGGDPNLPDKENLHTPVHYAAHSVRETASIKIKILLENDGNANANGKDGLTPLHCAILNKNDQSRLDIIKQLLGKGGNPNAEDVIGMTPVHYVICDYRSNSLKVLKMLLEHGGNILQENHFGDSPHRLATKMGSKQYCHPGVKNHVIKIYRKMK